MTLQNIFNVGYFGEALYILAVWLSLSAIARTKILAPELQRSILILLAFMTATGMTEPTTTIYQNIPFLFFIGILALCWSVSRYDGLAFVWSDRQDDPSETGAEEPRELHPVAT